MKRSVSRRITGVLSAAAVLVLVLGGVGFLRTSSNAERIDDRNLRELTRAGRAIERTVNNLDTVLKNSATSSESRADLIPHLTINSTVVCADLDNPDQAGRTVVRRVSAEGSLHLLHLCYHGVRETASDAATDTLNSPNSIPATYDLEGLRPLLATDYMEASFLADSRGTVFLRGPGRTSLRVHDLAGLDSLYLPSVSDTIRLGTSTIVRAPIAGRDYQFYLLPLRIDLAHLDLADGRQGSDEITWILGGLISASDHRQESLSLHPPVALGLGFLVIMGFLAVPFVRVYTMGLRERLRVGNLLYLAFALVLAAGLLGLGLADLAHYDRFKNDVYEQLNSTADQLAKNLDDEVAYALRTLDHYGDDLLEKFGYISPSREISDSERQEANDLAVAQLFDLDLTQVDPDTTDRMRVRIPQDTMYPELHMVFWADSAGQQVAKWTPRPSNTPLVEVDGREYHRVIRERVGWPQEFQASSKSVCTEDVNAADDDAPEKTYYLQSIRSSTTGEKLAAISTRFPQDAADGDPWGIGVVVTEMASLRRPVLPTGVGTAVVDSDANTLFHTRAERSLEENFAEETDKRDLVLSALHARACRALDVTYGGRRTRLAIRPLKGRPLFLITFMDRALLDTVQFEAWYLAAALLATLSLVLFVFGALVERIVPTRIRWMWPDVVRPGKYMALLAIAGSLLTVLVLHGFSSTDLPTYATIFLVPIQLLSLGLLALLPAEGRQDGDPEAALARASSPESGRRGGREAEGRETQLGWRALAFAAALVAAFAMVWQAFAWVGFATACVAVALALGWWRRPEVRKRVNDWWEGDILPQHKRRAGVASLVAVFVLAALALIWTEVVWLGFAAAFLAMLLALVLALAWWWRPDIRERVDEWTKRHILPRHAYPVAMGAGLLVVAVVPGYLAYQFAFLDRSELLVKQHQIETDNALRARNARLDSIMRQRLPADSEADRRRPFDLAFEGLMFDTAVPHPRPPTTDTTPASRWPRTPNWLFGDGVPFLTEASVRLRQLAEPQTDRTWRRNRDQIELETRSDSVLASTLPPPSARRGWLLGLLAALAGLGLTVHRVSRHVLFVHVEHSEPLTLEDAVPGPGNEWRSTIFVGTRSISREPIRRRADEVLLINMMSPSTDSGGTPRLWLDGGKVLCLDHFDHRITEPKWNEHVLAFLEQHIYSDNPERFILITSQDPDALLHTADSGEGLSADDKRRWDRLFGQFNKVILSDRVSPDGFRASVCEQLIVDVRSASKGVVADLSESAQVNATGEIERRVDRAEALLGVAETLVNPTVAGSIEQTAADLRVVAGKLEKELGDRGRPLAERVNALAGKATHASRVDRGRTAAGVVDQDGEGPADHRTGRRPAIPMRGPLKKDRTKIKGVCDTLIRECGDHERLQEVGQQILARPDWIELERDEIIDLVREGAETYYGARWAILTEEERRVVGQLAAGAVVNPRSRQAVTRLFARGFVVRGPEPRLDNESFTRFVQATVPGDMLTMWEREDTPSTWGLVRGPLILGLIGISLFLFWAQQDLFSSAVAFLSAVGVGLGAILRVLTMFEGRAGTSDSAALG